MTGKTKGEWPYHEDNHGDWKPCHSNPCKLHSGGDIMATSPEDAYAKAHAGDQETPGMSAKPKPENQHPDISTLSVGEAIDAFGMSIQPYQGGEAVKVVAYEAPGFNGDWVRSHKNEILKELHRRADAKKAEEQRRENIIDSIDGLDTIRQMQATYSREEAARRKAIYGDGTRAPEKRTVTREDIDRELEAHPMARLYLSAENEMLSHNDEIAALGEQVREDIIAGLDYDRIVERHDKAEQEYHERHMWD